MITILWSILAPFIKAEWRVLLGIVMVGGLYYVVYTHGFNNCEAGVAAAKEKATQEAQMIAGQEKQKIIDDHKKEIQKHLALEKDLTNELNKKVYTNCVVTGRGVRDINKLAN